MVPRTGFQYFVTRAFEIHFMGITMWDYFWILSNTDLETGRGCQMFHIGWGGTGYRYFSTEIGWRGTGYRYFG